MFEAARNINLNKRQIIRISLIVLFTTLAILTSFLISQRLEWGSSKGKVQNTIPVVVESNDTITLAFVGDLMCHSTQFNDAKTADGYDFSKAFAAVKPYLTAADLCFGNLETVIAGEDQNYTGYPMFNTPSAYLDAMKDAGFDVATNSNNHSLDRKFLGVQRTIDSLDARALKHTGTFKNAIDTSNILIVEAKGIKIAVLAYTYSTNGIRFDAGKEFSVAMIDSGRIERDVQRARKSNVDLIVACMHWGDEYTRQPNDYEKNYAGYLADLGVELIIGSHPHVLQPASFIQRDTQKSFIIYSLGNFFSGQRKPFTDYGMILRMQLIRNSTTRKTEIGKIDYIPTYVSNSNGFRILPVSDALKANQNKETSNPSYSPADQSRLESIWPEVTEHMNNPAMGFFQL